MKNRLIISIAIVAVVALVVITAVRKAPVLPALETSPPPAATLADTEPTVVARVEAPELRAQLERGAVTLIDVRDIDSYIAGHIAGALHIPLSRLEGEIPHLPKEKPIVVYCA